MDVVIEEVDDCEEDDNDDHLEPEESLQLFLCGEQKSKNEQRSNALNYFDSFLLTKKKFPPLRGTWINVGRPLYTSEMVIADLLSCQ